MSTLNSSQQLKKLEDRKKLQNCLSKSEIENICYSLMGLSNLITSSHCKCSQDPNTLAHGRLPKASEVGNPFRGESVLRFRVSNESQALRHQPRPSQGLLAWPFAHHGNLRQGCLCTNLCDFLSCVFLFLVHCLCSVQSTT